MVVDSLVISALASADSVLTEDEKELGVVLLDIGAGTTDVAVFKTGKLIHICTIPVGGHQVSKDLSIALGVPYEYAEELKLRWGCVLPEMVDASEEVLLPTMHGTGHKSFKRVDLCSPIYERIVETLHLVVMRLRQAGMERLPAAGVVLTGGTATMAGMVDLAKRAFHCPVRIGMPRELEGLPEEMHSPAFGASVGILLWSVRHHGEVRSYAARRSEALAGYKTVFTRLSSSTNARLKTAGHKFSAEFKKIYA
jgi:cell division protein FtsA